MKHLIASILLCALLTPASVVAQDNPPSRLVMATDQPLIAEIMRDEGFRAKFKTTDDGRTAIESSSGGVYFSVYFERCKDDNQDCGALVFSAGFDMDEPVDQSVITEWNTSQFTQAYLDKDGDPWCDFTVVMSGGMSRANFAANLLFYANEVELFATRIGYFSDSDVSDVVPPVLNPGDPV